MTHSVISYFNFNCFYRNKIQRQITDAKITKIVIEVIIITVADFKLVEEVIAVVLFFLYLLILLFTKDTLRKKVFNLVGAI